MAKNYTLYEAACVIAEGRDLAAIQDIGKRYPFALSRVTELTAKAGEDFVEFIKYLPEHTTANKFNAAVRAQIVEADEEDDDDEVVETKPVKKEKSAKAKPKKVEVEDDDDDDDDDEVEDLMSLPAKKLFKMCEDAGLTPSKNREKAYYIKLLNSVSEDDDDEEEEEVKPAKKSKKSEKPAKKSAKKAPKKVEPEDDWDDDDDDDDWDI